MKKTVSGIMSILLSAGMLMLAFNIQPAKAEGTIYIRADGSIDPPTAPISTVDSVTYTFTGNITSDADGIVVERSDVVVDGAGYTLQGSGSGTGFYWSWSGINNVTIKNTNIENFYDGIYLHYSSDNTISGNNVTNNKDSCGIRLDGSSNNAISGNNVTNNNVGVYFDKSNNNVVSGNNVANNSFGLDLYYDSSTNVMSGNNVANNTVGLGVYNPSVSNNIICGNNVANNYWGVYLSSSPNNEIYHNSFIHNTYQVELGGVSYVNIWDDGYPSGGNYWSDYTGVDGNGDGIGDTPYTIDLNNTDHYPLMSPSSVSPTPTDKSAIIVDPMYLEHQNRPFIYDVASYLSSAGYSCSWKPGSTVTVDWLKTGLRHGVILWRSHTIYDPNQFGVALNTGQLFDPQDIEKYKSSGDYPQRIIPTDLDGNGNRYWAITPQFILDYYGIQNRLPNSLVYVEACESIRDNAMAKAFVDSGAGAYVGYKDRIYFNNIFGVPFADNDAQWAMYAFCMKGFNVQQVVAHKVLGGYDKSYFGDKNLRLRTDIASAKTLSVSAYCPVDLLATDPLGRRVGIDPVSHSYVNEIPGAIYMGPDLETEFVWIPFIVEGEYDVMLIGTGTGSYDLKIEQEILPSTVVSQDYSGTITVNERHYCSVMFSGSGEMSTVSWEYFFEDVKRDTMLKISTDDHYFQFVAPGKDFGVKYDPKMKVFSHFIIICYGDSKMSLVATAVDDRIDYCSAVASDKQTHKCYLLIDKPN